MDETMNFGQLMQYIAKGDYNGGEVFVNELGQEIFFDGTTLKGTNEINVHSEWRYVDQVA